MPDPASESDPAPTTSLAPLERLRYFEGQILTADDLSTEQDYLRNGRRLHNRFLHGWGVVAGLGVTPGTAAPGSVQISPGYAISPQGDEILVPEAVSFALVGADGQPRGWLAVRYAELGARPVPAPPGSTEVQYSRTLETYELKLLANLPESHRAAKAADAAWARAARQALRRVGRLGWPVPPCPPCVEDPWVVLAAVRLPVAGSPTTAADIAFRDRLVLYGAAALQALTARRA